jgi:hypothetical protein
MVYMKDGSYEGTTAGNATKIYYCGSHSAVKSTIYPGMYEAKWGDWPLMCHASDYLPAWYFEQYRRYYKSGSQLLVRYPSDD